MKPTDYTARRTWQLEARARGEIPECGREACHRPADPAWLNHHTPLLYCAECAALINKHNPGFCYPEHQPLHAAATSGIAMRTALDTLAATTNIPTDPKLNRAQRRARGDYQRADSTVRRVR